MQEVRLVTGLAKSPRMPLPLGRTREGTGLENLRRASPLLPLRTEKARIFSQGGPGSAAIPIFLFIRFFKSLSETPGGRMFRQYLTNSWHDYTGISPIRMLREHRLVTRRRPAIDCGDELFGCETAPNRFPWPSDLSH
jgi:hypothetical protein